MDIGKKYVHTQPHQSTVLGLSNAPPDVEVKENMTVVALFFFQLSLRGPHHAVNKVQS